MSTLSYILLIIATIPALAYPAMIIAGIMGLAGHKPKDSKPSLYSVLFKTFIFLSLAYPIPLIVGWKLAKKATENNASETLFASIPLLYLLIIVVLFNIVISLEKKMLRERNSKAQALDY